MSWLFNETKQPVTVWIRAADVRQERVCSVCGRLVVVAHKADGLTVILNPVFDVVAIDLDKHGRIEQVHELALHTVTCREGRS